MSLLTVFEGDFSKVTKKILVGTGDVPVDDTELSNKKYVDDEVNSIEHWLRDAGTSTVFIRVPGDKVAGGLTSGGSFLIESTLNATKGDINLVGDKVTLSNSLQFSDITAPANPGDAKGLLYKKTGNDGLFYKPDSAGPEVDLTDSGVSGWEIDGNAGTTPPGQFIGTTDLKDFVIKTNNLARITISDNGDVGIGIVLPNDQLDISKNFRFPLTTSGSVGVINQGASRFIHSFGTASVFIGANAGNFTMSGSSNTGVGNVALVSLSNGSLNVGMGEDALKFVTSGNRNVGLGNPAGDLLTTGDDNICISNRGIAAESATIRIGNVQTRNFQAGIRCVTTGNADAITVVVDSAGQLGTVSSSRVFKKNIHDMADITNNLMKLRPVVFNYKSDKSEKTQYGLIAEEVLEVYPELVAHSADGKVETVHYRFLSSMLLNEVQKQKKLIDLLESRLTLLEQL